MSRTYRGLLPILLLVAWLAGCSEPIDPSAYPLSADRIVEPDRSALPELSLALIHTGDQISLDAFAYQGGSWTRSRVFVHSAVLVRHPRGDLLFDTGLGREVDGQVEADMPAYIRPVMKYTAREPAVVQLQNHGVDPAGIARIYISHLHWDHASGIEDFPQARIFTAREEQEAARDPAQADVYLASQFDADTVRWEAVEFIENPYMGYERSHDVFGDGSVVMVPMFGHTAGSMGMFVNLPDGRRFLFSGDTTWALEGFTRPAGKFYVASRLVDYDPGATRREIARVHRLMKYFPKLIVVPAHDFEVQQRLGFFPAYIAGPSG